MVKSFLLEIIKVAPDHCKTHYSYIFSYFLRVSNNKFIHSL